MPKISIFFGEYKRATPNLYVGRIYLPANCRIFWSNLHNSEVRHQGRRMCYLARPDPVLVTPCLRINEKSHYN